MFFNSIIYFVFIFIAASIYFYVPHRFRWIVLLVFGYYFNLHFGFKYIALILYITAISFAAGIAIRAVSHDRSKKILLATGLAFLLMPLFYFKYLNFFVSVVNQGLAPLGAAVHVNPVEHALPIGISFFTFMAIGYTVDVFTGKGETETNVGKMALFLSFFPIIVSGPIERANRLIPQFQRKTIFDYERVGDGLLRVLWGLFKKVVIADRLALYVGSVYANGDQYSGLPLIIAAYFYAFQIYCDFSGYTDMAIGSAKILGFDIMENFNRPYCAQSIPDFWRRWHISLSTWLRDYVYIPLGGNRCSTARRYGNIFLTFFICGFWHGALWTFMFWGMLFGFYYCISILKRPLSLGISARLGADNSLLKWMRILVTFHLVAFAWIFFRSDTMVNAIGMVANMGKNLSSFAGIDAGNGITNLIISIVLIVFLLGIEWFVGDNRRIEKATAVPLPARFLVYGLFVIAFAVLGVFHGSDFIYFKF